MNWSQAIFNLTAIWNMLHFELIIVSHDSEVLHYNKSLMLFKLDEFHTRNTNFLRLARNNILIFYKPLDAAEFRRTFEQVALAHNSSLSTPDSSIYHFVIWPLTLVDSLELCSQIELWNATRFLSLNTNVFVVYSDLKRQILISEVYFVHKSTICQNLPTSSFLDLRNKVRRRNHFQNIVITATAAVQENTATEVSYNEVNGRIVSATGSAVRIFNDLMDMLHFNGNYTRGDWVMRNSSTRRLFGISVGQLRRGEAQLYLTQTTLAPYRATEFNFLQPTFQDALNAFFQQPPSSTVTDVHISPFQTSLWLSIFATWTLLGVSVFTISYIQVHLETEGKSVFFDKINKLHEAVIWAIGAGCTQGWHKFPKSTSLRIVLLCGAASGLVNFITYSGAIISSLTSEVAPIQTLLDLLSSSLEIYFDRDSSTIHYIIQDLKNTSSRKSAGFTGSSVATGLSSIMNQPSAQFGFSRNLYFEAHKMNISAHRLCGCISSVPIQKLPLQNGMLLPKWSPYRESFNYRLIQLKERGFNFRYSKTFITESSIPCPKVLHSYREDLGILDVFTAFAILIGGTLLSTLIFIIEKFVSITRSSSHRRRLVWKN